MCLCCSLCSCVWTKGTFHIYSPHLIIIKFNLQVHKITWKHFRCWCTFRSVFLLFFFFPAVTVEHHGKQMYVWAAMWVSPLHVYCMSPSAEYGSMCHMFTCRFSMHDVGEGAAHVIRLCDRSPPFTWPASYAYYFYPAEIMDLECFCSERKTSVPTSSAFDLIAPSPPHSEIICPLIWCSA